MDGLLIYIHKSIYTPPTQITQAFFYYLTELNEPLSSSSLGVEVTVTSMPSKKEFTTDFPLFYTWHTQILLNLSTQHQWQPDLIVYNGVHYANLVFSLPLLIKLPFRTLFVILEPMIYSENKLDDGFYHAAVWQVIQHKRMWLVPDRVLFVSDAVSLLLPLFLFPPHLHMSFSIRNHNCVLLLVF